MNLRSRLLLGYWYLVALLILSAAAAALGFHRLGTNIGRVLDENFESVRASMTMLHALERQDSAILASLLDQAGASHQITQSDHEFSEALKAAQGNVTLESEQTILRAVDERYRAFCEAREHLLASVPERPLLAYETTAFPHFESVKAEVLKLLDVNHQAMVAADRTARSSAQSRAVVHGSLVILAIVSLGLLSRGLGSDLLDRLAELRSVAQALSSGDRARRVTVVRDDELGLVAQQINALLDREIAAEGELSHRVQTMRHMVLALLDSCAGTAALLSPTGQLMASALGEEDTELVEKAAAGVSDQLKDGSTPQLEAVAEGREINFRRLEDHDLRPVGWLATITGRGSDDP